MQCMCVLLICSERPRNFTFQEAAHQLLVPVFCGVDLCGDVQHVDWSAGRCVETCHFRGQSTEPSCVYLLFFWLNLDSILCANVD